MKCYKSCILLLLFIVLSAVILERRSRHTTAAIQETSPTMLDSSGHDQDTINILKRQRDELSSAMMKLSSRFLQYQCQVGTARGVTEHGGWCGGYQDHRTDIKLASALADLFSGETVASFGDGPGSYKQLLDKSGKVPLFHSFDGAPFSENKTNGLVKFLDLTIPVYGLRLYDWVLSLEVAEHIPKQYEQIYLDNVVRHAGKGVVLSWSAPKQVGRGHVNNQPPDYVINQMEMRGFRHDNATSHRLRGVCKYYWLKRNVNVFMRRPEHAARLHDT